MHLELPFGLLFEAFTSFWAPFHVMREHGIGRHASSRGGSSLSFLLTAFHDSSLSNELFTTAAPNILPGSWSHKDQPTSMHDRSCMKNHNPCD